MQSANQANTPSSACSCSGGCCDSKVLQRKAKDPYWVTGRVVTPAGIVPQVSVRLTSKDILGTWKVRWGIKRMNYRVNPGLYCIGVPEKDSPVLVTANYKMSFDRLRSELEGVNAWILVLDTKGINVWCAAGKGTFGTSELIDRIRLTDLALVTDQRTLILPQLGAPGVSAHEIARQSGFRVLYGPVRAEDLKQFLASGMKTTPEMRTVKFTFTDRLVLTPMELVNSIKPAFIIFGLLFVLNSAGIAAFGITDLYGLLGAYFAGAFLTPVLLPWIPFRSFYLKGWLIGLLWALALNFLNGWPDIPGHNWTRALAYILALPAIAAFCAMNFTGCSTYTSPSGVEKEMKTAIPAIIISAGLGVLLILADGLLKL